MSDHVFVRPMSAADVDAAYSINSLAFTGTAEEKEQVRGRSAEENENRKAPYRHLLGTDPAGCSVAVAGDGRVAGSALSIRREGVWVLSLFAVDEAYRGAGVGLKLLDRALAYGEGCRGGMIASSEHPAAMRRYASAGFVLRPALRAVGRVRPRGLPAVKGVRDGTEGDLELVSEVDRGLRGAAHGPDVEFVLRSGARLFVAERSAGAGYAVLWYGSPLLVAATAPGVAADLLRVCLAEGAEGEEVRVSWITGEQAAWAVPVVLEAGLSLSPAGPICTRGELGPLTPYLPSGYFL